MTYETLDLAIQALVASNAQLVSSVTRVQTGVESAASGVDAKVLVLQTEIEQVLDIINGEQP